MTRDEVIDLLTLATAYDRRTVGRADVEAWHDAATRMRWTYDEAREALKAHYATSAEFLMPGHITTALRQERRQPPFYRRLELEAAAPAAEGTRADVMSMVGNSFAMPREAAHVRPDRGDTDRDAARRELDAIRYRADQELR